MRQPSPYRSKALRHPHQSVAGEVFIFPRSTSPVNSVCLCMCAVAKRPACIYGRQAKQIRLHMVCKWVTLEYARNLCFPCTPYANPDATNRLSHGLHPVAQRRDPCQEVHLPACECHVFGKAAGADRTLRTARDRPIPSIRTGIVIPMLMRGPQGVMAPLPR